jgi:hypothetical protein
MSANLWLNPSAATDLSNVGFDHGAYGTLTRATDNGLSGSTSFRLEKTSAGGIINIYNSLTGGFAAGQIATLSGWCETPSANVFCGLQMIYFNAGVGVITSTETAPLVAVGSDWSQFSYAFTLPATTVSVIGAFRFGKDAAFSQHVDVGTVVYVTDIHLHLPDAGGTLRQMRSNFELRPY